MPISDAFALVEELIGIAACMPPTVPVPKPGPCPGPRGVRSVKPGKAARGAGKTVQKKTAQPTWATT